MSGELSFGERISYETLLLIWLDRVNKALQFPQNIKSGSIGLPMWAISGAEAVKALYYMLIPELREKVDEKLGTPLPKYLGYDLSYTDLEGPAERPFIYRLRILLHDLREEMEKELEKVSGNPFVDEKEIKGKYYRRSILRLILRAREAVKAIVDVLHESGLLLRERELFKGEA